MHHEAQPIALLPRQGLRPRAELRGRILLPFHQAPNGAAHDLLVMNHHPDMAPPAGREEAWPRPDRERRAP